MPGGWWNQIQLLETKTRAPCSPHRFFQSQSFSMRCTECVGRSLQVCQCAASDNKTQFACCWEDRKIHLWNKCGVISSVSLSLRVGSSSQKHLNSKINKTQKSCEEPRTSFLNDTWLVWKLRPDMLPKGTFLTLCAAGSSRIKRQPDFLFIPKNKLEGPLNVLMCNNEGHWWIQMKTNELCWDCSSEFICLSFGSTPLPPNSEHACGDRLRMRSAHLGESGPTSFDAAEDKWLCKTADICGWPNGGGGMEEKKKTQ